jgi:hypothetical protein
MELQLPAWFKYRQGKAEPAGDDCFQLTAPQIAAAFIRIRANGGKWQAAVSDSADGPDIRVTDFTWDMPRDAWAAAFELYRSLKM